MAPKRPFEDPPPASSSEEESESDAADEEVNGGSEGVEDDEEKSGDEEEEEEEEEDVAHNQNKKPSMNKSTLITPSKASERQASLGSGDESGTESDSESNKTQPSPSVSDFTIKPIASKPMDDSVKPKKSAPKRNLTEAPVTKVTAASKRPSESYIEGKDSKKKKLSNGHDEDVKKGSGIQRLWNEDDEIAILKGMIEYKSKKGADPYADMGAFHEFIKKNLHADVSKNQLQDKIRRLKKKYLVNAEKGENGEDPVFSKPHEHKSFELSKKIWGPGAAAAANVKRKATQSKVKNSSTLESTKLEVVGKKKEEPSGEIKPEIKAEPEKTCSNGFEFDAVKAPLQSCSQSNFLDGLLASEKLLTQPQSATSIMKEALPLVGTAKAKELETKWKKLQEEEFQLFLKRIELFKEIAKLALEAKQSFRS